MYGSLNLAVFPDWSHIDKTTLNILDSHKGMSYINVSEVLLSKEVRDVWSYPLEFVR